jgi:hypothetical protein
MILVTDLSTLKPLYVYTNFFFKVLFTNPQLLNIYAVSKYETGETFWPI